MIAMKFRDRQRQRGLQARDAESSAFKLHFLFVRSMRSVVGCNRIHRAVRQRDHDRLAISRRTQRRIHLEIRVVLANVFVDQREVMRSDFASHAGFGALSRAVPP